MIYTSLTVIPAEAKSHFASKISHHGCIRGMTAVCRSNISFVCIEKDGGPLTRIKTSDEKRRLCPPTPQLSPDKCKQTVEQYNNFHATNSTSSEQTATFFLLFSIMYQLHTLFQMQLLVQTYIHACSHRSAVSVFKTPVGRIGNHSEHTNIYSFSKRKQL